MLCCARFSKKAIMGLLAAEEVCDIMDANEWSFLTRIFALRLCGPVFDDVKP